MLHWEMSVTCVEAEFYKARRRLTLANLMLLGERWKLDKNVNGPCERDAVRSWSVLLEYRTSLAWLLHVLETLGPFNDSCDCALISYQLPFTTTEIRVLERGRLTVY